MSIEYVVSSGAWSIGGFIIGMIMGRMSKDVHKISDQLSEDDDDDT